MVPYQEYTPKSIRHISITVPKRKGRTIPKSELLILLKPKVTLDTAQIALIGTRLLDLRPLSVTSTVLSNRDFITIIIYITEDIAHMDASVFAYNPSYPLAQNNPKHLMHTQINCYTALIPLLDAAMTTVLQENTINPKGIWP